MAEIIFEEVNCAECEKLLEKCAIAVVVEKNFVVCIECNEAVESSWAFMQEVMARDDEEFPEPDFCGGVTDGKTNI